MHTPEHARRAALWERAGRPWHPHVACVGDGRPCLRCRICGEANHAPQHRPAAPRGRGTCARAARPPVRLTRDPLAVTLTG